MGDNVGRPLFVVHARRICGLISSSHVHSWRTLLLCRDITHARFGGRCATGLLTALLEAHLDKGDATPFVLTGLHGEEMEPRLCGDEPQTASKLASKGSKCAMVSSKVSVAVFASPTLSVNVSAVGGPESRDASSRTFSVNALGRRLSESRSDASRSLR